MTYTYAHQPQLGEVQRFDEDTLDLNTLPTPRNQTRQESSTGLRGEMRRPGHIYSNVPRLVDDPIDSGLGVTST